MNQKSKEESLEQTNYLLSLTCSEEHEAHIRFLLMHMVSSEGIGLKELYSEDVDSNQKSMYTSDITLQHKYSSLN